MTQTHFRSILCALLTLVWVTSMVFGQLRPSVVATGAKLMKVGDGYQFTEGPAADAQGDVFFSDIPASRTYKWSPDGKITLFREENDGRLSHKRFFAPVGADGMKLDREGNVYMAEKGIVVYDSAGKYRETIAVPHEPTNLCFAGPESRTLFITARPAIYTLRMRVAVARLEPQKARP